MRASRIVCPQQRGITGRARHLLRLAAALTLAGCLLPGPARAVVRPAFPAEGAIAPRGAPSMRIADEARAAALEAAPAWQAFLARHGAWRTLMWNEVTGSPHRAIGPGIALAGFANDSGSADRAVRGFVAGHPGVFGAPALRTVASFRAGRLWYVRYRQQLHGMDVLDADWEFRVGGNGRLFAFGADVQPAGAPPPARATMPRGAARALAARGVSIEPERSHPDDDVGPVLLPVVTERGLEHRPVHEIEVTADDPPARWRSLVDAVTGEVLLREDLVRHEVRGETRAAVHLRLPTDALTERPLSNHKVTVGDATVVSDAAGAWSAPAAGATTVSARFNGPFCEVRRFDGDATFSSSVTAPATVPITWSTSNSTASERDAFYHVNLAHDHIKALDPGLTALDFPMVVRVDVNSSCNALWSGRSIYLYRANAVCPSTATMPDVVYHEYGHGVNDLQYFQAGARAGMRNAALHEGLADAFAAFIQDDPVGGKGLFGRGSFVRTIETDARWPQDASADPHLTGLIIGGALWDLRRSIGLGEARRLMHFARYGIPDDASAGVAMSEFFAEVVIADDDDSDLSNGTPHLDAIVAAFNRHGIGTRSFMRIEHAPIADRAAGEQHVVQATIRHLAPAATLDRSRLTLVYSVNEGPDRIVPLTPADTPDRFGALIEARAPAVVRYHLTAGDVWGESVTDPRGAPGKRHVFIVGPQATLISHNFESDHGWMGRGGGDNAWAGLWVRAVPVGTFVGTVPVQPFEDHTLGTGVACYVTGNAPGGAPPETNNVDNGRTSLLTPLFDATGHDLSAPTIEYYRWYSNDAGTAPGQDEWRVDITNDGGGTWVPVEATTATDNTWRRVAFRIADYVTPTTEMVVRFVASDENPASLVEAAVDDFRLFGFHLPPVARVEAPDGGESLTVGAVAQLRWNASDDTAVTGVDLLLSRDGADGPFEPLATGIGNHGTFDWRVTGPTTTRALLKVVAHDGGGNTGSDVSDAEFAIHTPPDCSGARAHAAWTWPPRHAFAPVAITGVTDRDGDPVTVHAVAVTSDEPVDGRGDGATCPDATIANGVASVRIERAGGGNGRVYRVRFIATDARGGTCEGSVPVCVPHDRGGAGTCVDDGQTANAIGPCGADAASTAGIAPDATAPAAWSLEVNARDGIAGIRFALPHAASARIDVFDVTGRRVERIALGPRAAGTHDIRWPIPAPGGGMFFYRLEAGGERITRRVIHLP